MIAKSTGIGNWAWGIEHGGYLTRLDISTPESTPLARVGKFRASRNTNPGAALS